MKGVTYWNAIYEKEKRREMDAAQWRAYQSENLLAGNPDIEHPRGSRGRRDPAPPEQQRSAGALPREMEGDLGLFEGAGIYEKLRLYALGIEA